MRRLTLLIPLAAILVVLTGGCRMLMPMGPLPDPDVSNWPEYALKIDDNFVAFRFHPKADRTPVWPDPKPGEINELDMSWLKDGRDVQRLIRGRFEWNPRVGLPGFEFGIDLATIDEAAVGNAPLDRLEDMLRKQDAIVYPPRPSCLKRLRIGDRDWLVSEIHAGGALGGEAYLLPLTDTYCLVVAATYGPHPRAKEWEWIEARRRILRQTVEHVKVSHTPPRQ